MLSSLCYLSSFELKTGRQGNIFRPGLPLRFVSFGFWEVFYKVEQTPHGWLLRIQAQQQHIHMQWNKIRHGPETSLCQLQLSTIHVFSALLDERVIAVQKTTIQTNRILEGVRYEIRGELAHRAMELERQGYEIISLNIGNPGLFGYRTPETMRLAMIENLGQSEAYCHQKGIFPAREAVVMQQQDRGVTGCDGR